MTAHADAHALARTFFDEFVDAFRSFDGEVIARRYLVPYLAFHDAASMQVFVSADDIAAYFQRIVDEYHARGCRACRYKDMSVVALGAGCAVGTVTWELLAQDQSVISAWRESYNLCEAEGRYKVYASTDHAG